MNNQEEVWKDIPNYEGRYQVSNLGRVKSLSNNKHKEEMIMKCSVVRTGYYRCTLFLDNVKKTIKVHKLVAMAFLNHKPCGMKVVVDHINGNRLDNRVENLQIITNRQNLSKDKVGTSKFTGVSWNKAMKKWVSQIYIENKKTHLGYFESEIEASIAYKNKLNELINK